MTAVADEIRGEEVFAFVVARGGVAADIALAAALQAECLERLAYFKVPAYFAYLARSPTDCFTENRAAGTQADGRDG